MFKIASSIHINIKPNFLYYSCLLSQLPIPCSVLYVIFFFKTLATLMGHCERDIVRATKHQGWGWSQYSFWLVLCTIFGIFPSRNLGFQIFFFLLLLVFSFVYVFHDYFSVNGLLSSKYWSPLRCRHLLKFLGKMKISGEKEQIRDSNIWHLF